jgi:hypothetical protein
MDPFRFRSASTEDDTTIIGVSIERMTHEPYNTHTGVVYRDDGGRLLHLHLAWHLNLRNSRLQNGCLFVIPDIPEDRLPFLRVLCMRIATNPQRLTYALRYPRSARFVVATGELIGDQRGLNCATFVLTFLSSYGVDIVDVENWPLRLADAQWQQYLVDRVRDDYPDHADRIQEEVGSQRVRPEEVAAACLYGFDLYPLDFERVHTATCWLLPVLIPRDCCCL